MSFIYHRSNCRLFWSKKWNEPITKSEVSGFFLAQKVRKDAARRKYSIMFTSREETKLFTNPATSLRGHELKLSTYAEPENDLENL